MDSLEYSYPDMSTVIAEAEKLAFSLPENERAKLAGRLLRSLRPVVVDDDDGVEEAMRRSRELEEHPEIAISHEEFLAFFENRKIR